MQYLTIPTLAKRLGVTAPSVRAWINRGYIEEPPEMPVSGARAYPLDAALRIEQWYIARLREGRTRGPGTAKRRKRAEKQAES